MNEAVDRIVHAFENLSPGSVDGLEALYTHDARFKDPFNEVQGLSAILGIYRHMYEALDAPRFVVTGRTVQGQQCFLTWELHFRFRRWHRGQTQCIVGGSHLLLDGEGHISVHRDYWDAAEELYEKIPLLGSFMRWLRWQGRAR